MIRVRFPNGQCVTYNNGNFVECLANGTGRRIATKKGGDPVAWVTNDCIIEWVRPCSVENPLDGDLLGRAADLIESMEGAGERLDSRTDEKLRRIKNALRSFNLTTRSWR